MIPDQDSKAHYWTTGNSDRSMYGMACGMHDVHPNNAVSNPNKVTCRNCLRVMQSRKK